MTPTPGFRPDQQEAYDAFLAASAVAAQKQGALAFARAQLSAQQNVLSLIQAQANALVAGQQANVKAAQSTADAAKSEADAANAATGLAYTHYQQTINAGTPPPPGGAEIV